MPEKDFADFKAPEPTLPRSPGHHEEWINSCKTGSPTGTHFAYATALTEIVLLGNVALRTGQKLVWDSANLKAINAASAEQYVRPQRRKDWSL